MAVSHRDLTLRRREPRRPAPLVSGPGPGSVDSQAGCPSSGDRSSPQYFPRLRGNSAHSLAQGASWYENLIASPARAHSPARVSGSPTAGCTAFAASASPGSPSPSKTRPRRGAAPTAQGVPREPPGRDEEAIRLSGRRRPRPERASSRGLARRGAWRGPR
jgi:hypothetical protein